jgi:amino acid adenylation domain-containing protein
MVAVSACLHHLIEAQAKRTPDAPALAFEGERLTYADLERRANRLAHELARRSVGPDVTVALHLERSLEVIVAILAILKAGGAYVPIDPSYPAERVAFMVSDSGAKVVVTRDTFDALDWTASLPKIRSQVTSRHLAYVIYTSGSTGKPKGVCVEHRNIVNYVLGVIERFSLEPGMSYATVSTIAADLGNTVIFPALASGGCLHVVSRERVEDAAQLGEYFAREQIDVLKIVPSHLAALQAGGDPARVMPAKRLILGGEASRLDWVEKLRSIAPKCEIYNHYGPTETTVGALTYRVGSGPVATRSDTVPLGMPLPGIEVRLADGEICIGGAGVARGYLNRPELTAERFAGGVYRTGDLGRELADGSIEFCGRVDHQVKVHGYRVELGEIESALRAHGEVRDAVVLMHEERLIACVTPQYVEPQTLREYLRQRLPAYMVPSVFLALERLPLTANGKTDRQALAALAQERAPARRDLVAPRTETEKALAAIWSELLEVEAIGLHDDVFDLGAHSLMAMKALTRIRDRFQVSVSLRHLFEHPTVATLANAVDSLWLAQAPRPPAGEREEIVL